MHQTYSRHAVLSELAPFDEEAGDLQDCRQIPRAAGTNTSTTPRAIALSWLRLCPEGMVFPYDFGFLPGRAIGQDGDPLDVLVLMERASGRPVA